MTISRYKMLVDVHGFNTKLKDIPKIPSQDYRQAYLYAADIITGHINSNKYIKLACQRFIDDLNLIEDPNFKYFFSIKKAQRIVDFYKHMKHTDGDFYGQPFELMPWQIFIVSNIIGWLKKEPHHRSKKHIRRFTEAQLWVARKNGKSALSSGLALYYFLADGEHGAQIYSVGPSLKQAKIVYDQSTKIINGMPVKYDKAFKQRFDGMHYGNSKYQPLANNSSTLDGLSSHLVVCDEIHEWTDRNLYGVMDTSTGARTQPLMLVISTAGTILDGIAVDLYKRGQRMLDKVIQADHMFTMLYGIDEDDDYFTEETWIKANPALGVVKELADMRKQAATARDLVSERNGFLTKHLNVFCHSEKVWLKKQDLDKCILEMDFESDKYKKYDCYIGADLAQKIDLTAVSAVFKVPETDTQSGKVEYHMMQKHYISRGAINKASEQVQNLYEVWSQMGYLEIVESSITDFDLVRDYILDLSKKYKVIDVAFDPAQGNQLMNDLRNNHGINVVEVKQTPVNLNEPVKRIEAMIVDGRLKYNGDKVFEYCCSNALLKNHNNNIVSIVKNANEDKTDSLMAMIVAASRITEESNRSIYEDMRGLVSTKY
ncbi:terminase large subunit [Shewanella baltica]|uniref:terminase large subunit n=1 Tax=Shewanella baltica TaxID=62322 RepID=UPI003D7B2056